MNKKILTNNFVQGSILITGSTFFVSILNYVFNLIIARGVSLADYGEYYSVIAHVVILTIPCGAFASILIRKIGSVEPEERTAYAYSLEQWLLSKLRSNLHLLVVGSAILYSFLLFKSNLESISILFILLMSFLTIWQMFFLATMQAYKAFLLFGIYTVATSLLRLITGAGITLISGKLPFLLAALLGVMITQVISGHLLLFRKVKLKANPVTFPNFVTLITKPTIIIPLLTTLGIVGLSNLDIILVKKFMSESDAGLYGAYSLLSKIIFFVAGPLASVGYIFFTGKEHKKSTNLILAAIVFLTLIIGASATSFYFFFSHFTISMFFDDRFLSFSQFLWLGGVYGTLYSLVMLFAQYFIAKNSKISTLALIALVFQAGGIYFFHNDLQNVMSVNILVSFVLLLVYLSAFVIQWLTDSKKVTEHVHNTRSLH